MLELPLKPVERGSPGLSHRIELRPANTKCALNLVRQPEGLGGGDSRKERLLGAVPAINGEQDLSGGDVLDYRPPGCR